MPRQRRSAPTTPDHTTKPQETWIEQWSSFIGFFIYLLILKTFFLPLFIIPTGSMAETLRGAHATHTCPNCGTEYAVGWQQPPNWPQRVPYHPPMIFCPNCRWRQVNDPPAPGGRLSKDVRSDEILASRLRPSAGDRIFVHGWLYDAAFRWIDGPKRWDVVVFKVPTDGQTNYIKRLIGMPGDTLEIINGDIFVDGQLLQKRPDAQRSLWFDYYNHDYPAQEPADWIGYFPRWAIVDGADAWDGVQARVVRFDGEQAERGTIQFVTEPDDTTAPGLVQDVYAYNHPKMLTQANMVPDVRLSAEIAFESLDMGGYVELIVSRGEHRFFARLDDRGRLTLEHAGDHPSAGRIVWDETTIAVDTPVHLSLAHLDGQALVEVDGRRLLGSTLDQYEVTPGLARAQSMKHRSPLVRIAAENTQATLRHLLIERDVYYTSDLGSNRSGPVFGVQGRPITLGEDEYFVLGDNSPNSRDGRYSFANSLDQAVGPHLRGDLERGEYNYGTVPGDQMIGRAFFVYWPGFMPLRPIGLNLLPDLGQVRWIW